jgi:hypothetical protein
LDAMPVPTQISGSAAVAGAATVADGRGLGPRAGCPRNGGTRPRPSAGGTMPAGRRQDASVGRAGGGGGAPAGRPGAGPRMGRLPLASGIKLLM